jgi:hypothetical protein
MIGKCAPGKGSFSNCLTVGAGIGTASIRLISRALRKLKGNHR